MAVKRARHRIGFPRSRLLLLAVAACAVLFLAGSVFVAQMGQQSAQDQTAAVVDQRDATAAQAHSLASQIQAACASSELSGPVCEQAAQVAAEPVPPAEGPRGERGGAGSEGRGVRDMAINPAGHLVVTYTDGASEDVGPVVGATGADGEPGRGIADVGITAGRLVVTYSDGGTHDLGPVVGTDGRNGLDGRDGVAGRDGRGIASVDQVNGRLIVTYTDGATQDAGPLPAGPQGEEGPSGEPEECPEGSTMLPVEYDEGVAGYGCVLDEQPVEPPPATIGPNGDQEDELPGE